MPPFGFDDIFEVEPARNEPVNPWSAPPKVTSLPLPAYADDEDLKKLFGIELGKGLKAFEAATIISDGDASKALWISSHWLSDPIVIASKDAYAITLKQTTKPLDKEQLLAKILELSENDLCDDHGRPIVDAKERLSALNLYAEISGFKVKAADTANSNTTNNTFNKITKVVLVSPTVSKQDINPNIKSKIQNVEIPSLPLKLVGGSAR